jgi:hypothetical protein
MVESPAQFGRLKTLIHPGPVAGVHVNYDHKVLVTGGKQPKALPQLH